MLIGTQIKIIVNYDASLLVLLLLGILLTTLKKVRRV